MEEGGVEGEKGECVEGGVDVAVGEGTEEGGEGVDKGGGVDVEGGSGEALASLI